MTSLANDITIVKTLPKSLKGARRKKEIPSFKVANSQSPYYYLHHVFSVLKRHSVVELVVSDGGCLQVIFFTTFSVLFSFTIKMKKFLRVLYMRIFFLQIIQYLLLCY